MPKDEDRYYIVDGSTGNLYMLYRDSSSRELVLTSDIPVIDTLPCTVPDDDSRVRVVLC